MENHPKSETKEMTFWEYLEFLDQYWEIFGPPPRKEHVEYKNVQF